LSSEEKELSNRLALLIVIEQMENPSPMPELQPPDFTQDKEYRGHCASVASAKPLTEASGNSSMAFSILK
jgi:hypothetical protein